jgi:hypothetical protein
MAIHKLTPATVTAAIAKGQPGTWADGGKLFLRITPSGGAHWVFRYRHGGKDHLIAIGSPGCRTLDNSGTQKADREKQAREHIATSLALARETATKLRTAIKEGHDPKVERSAARAHTTTFQQCCETYLVAQNEPPRWRQSLRDHVWPAIGALPVRAITKDHILAVLQPLWTGTCVTGSRVRDRIKKVLDYAEAEGLRSGTNPAAKEQLGHYLPSAAKARSIQVEHHRDVPWQQIPAFWNKLRANDSTAARALALIILTACRAGDLLGQDERNDPKLPAQWSDIDLDAGIWSIARPKVAEHNGVPWQIPLSGPALEVLREQRVLRSRTTLVAESEHTLGRPINRKRLREVLRTIAPDADTHGFRASFRSWAGANGHDRELAEACLNHRLLGDRAELAYKRDQLTARRRVLLEHWAAYCCAPAA